MAAAATCSKCVTTGGIDTVGRRATTGATTRDHSIVPHETMPPHETIPNWNVGVIATAKRIRETARAVHCVIALAGAVAEPGGAEVASTIESAAVRGAWWMLKVDRPVDGLYAETAGDHVAWCVEGSNAALTAPEIVNSIHMWSDVFVVNGSADGSLMKERARSCLIQISVPAASPPGCARKKRNETLIQVRPRLYSYY